MPIVIETAKPADLLSAIKKKIDSKEIHTWSCQNDTFEYLAAQYTNEAVLDAAVGSAELSFKLRWKKSATKQSYAVMAVYFGRFVEEVLAHFDKASFTRIRIAPLR